MKEEMTDEDRKKFMINDYSATKLLFLYSTISSFIDCKQIDGSDINQWVSDALTIQMSKYGLMYREIPCSHADIYSYSYFPNEQNSAECFKIFENKKTFLVCPIVGQEQIMNVAGSIMYSLFLSILQTPADALGKLCYFLSIIDYFDQSNIWKKIIKLIADLLVSNNCKIPLLILHSCIIDPKCIEV
jgi:hypothetical protein